MSEQPYRILIIEDNPEDREVYRRGIAQGREQDYLFWETASGEEGLRLCREMRPDCILLDYQLPDLDGLEFLDRFQAEAGEADIAVIMLTGQGNEAVAVQAMKKGALDYLVKGFGSDNLRLAVQSALDKAILRRRIEEQRRELERLSAERLELIAELQDHAAALAEANQRKDEFLAMLAHELRNPLAPISNGLQVLRRTNPRGSSLEPICAMLERQVHHLVRLVDDLLDVSRITRGKIHLCKERGDLVTLVQRAVETCRRLFDERQHQLILSLPSEPVWLEADSVRLEQILANLLNNAAKYTPPGGKIWLSGQREQGEVVLRVRDNGVGIAPELLPRVFELFMQADHSLARTQGGLGIGLTLVRLLVQLHGGSVQATSAGLGQGTEFVVRLPCLPEVPAPAEPARPPTVGNTRSLRVLVVDNNVDAGETLARLLQMSGHEVHLTHDGPSALQAAETFHPEVALLDIGMPGMDGYQVAERLRSRGDSDLLLVAVTGYGQEEDRRRSQAAGFDHHMVKPVRGEALQAILATRDARPTPRPGA